MIPLAEQAQAQAQAQAPAGFAGEIAFLTDDLYRGRSISAGRSVARLGLSYDALAGLYGGVSATFLPRGDDGQWLAVQEYAGYARRLRPGLTLDLGIMRTDYSRHWSGARAAAYTELHLGLGGRRLNGRLHVSPDYLRRGWKTAYGEANAVLFADERWEIGAHGGLFLWVAGGRPAGAGLAHYDWSVAAARRIGPVRIGAGWSAGGPQRDYYDGQARHHGAPTVSLAAAF